MLQPYLFNNPERMKMLGPRVPLSPRLAVVLSMIIHEIATNAAKYGALSNDTGMVAIDWEVVDEPKPKLRLIWTETGGPPVVTPVHRGFGSRLIERSARDQLGGEATVDFLPRGVVYTVICSLEEEGSRCARSWRRSGRSDRAGPGAAPQGDRKADQAGNQRRRDRDILDHAVVAISRAWGLDPLRIHRPRAASLREGLAQSVWCSGWAGMRNWRRAHRR